MVWFTYDYACLEKCCSRISSRRMCLLKKLRGTIINLKLVPSPNAPQSLQSLPSPTPNQQWRNEKILNDVKSRRSRIFQF
ncbi:hypothetical protein KIN20_022071 [Parelaphostrongylus tenuis]|uniref:Uncharacterized protein n=1 Tax=Parelaphostrongylus tenuis TaxID=148309 RepID=A0AAD5QWJ8_PARTN|nr:hypothetical protein KIN20_022071 [Parelaphostrongylus tenuis]